MPALSCASLISPSHESEALTACLTISLAVMAVAFSQVYKDQSDDRHRLAWRVLLLVSLAGTLLSTWSLSQQAPAWRLDAAVICSLAALLGLVAVGLGAIRSWEGRSLRSLASRLGRWRTLILVAGVGAALLAGVILGVLLKTGGSLSVQSITVAEHPYRVAGTCADGSCILNECSEPASCGLQNVGRLREGQLVDIDCQLRGKKVKAPDGTISFIWDRLASGAYVSDLYVSTPVTNRFTDDLPRCAD